MEVLDHSIAGGDLGEEDVVAAANSTGRERTIGEILASSSTQRRVRLRRPIMDRDVR
jgi:hypothetical protein